MWAGDAGHPLNQEFGTLWKPRLDYQSTYALFDWRPDTKNASLCKQHHLLWRVSGHLLHISSWLVSFSSYVSVFRNAWHRTAVQHPRLAFSPRSSCKTFSEYDEEVRAMVIMAPLSSACPFLDFNDQRGSAQPCIISNWNYVFREGGKATEGRRTGGTSGGIHSVHSVKGLKVRSCALAVTALMLSMLVGAP